MFHRFIRPLAIGGLFLATACDRSPTEPEVASTPSPDAPALAVASNTWITRAAMPGTERLGLTSAVVPNASGERILYVIGGSSNKFLQPSGPTREALATVQAYNPATNTWTTKAPLPLALYRTNGAVTIGGKIYVSGGRLTGDKKYVGALFVYSPSTNTWTRKREMPGVTWGGVSGAIGGKLYVLTCAGEELCDQFQRQEMFRYDPATDTWTVLGMTPIGLGEPLGGVIGGKLYVTGGSEGRLLVYDPATNTFTERAKLPKQRIAGAGATLGGKLYIMGGYEFDRATVSRTLVRKTTVYDPATNTWSNRAPLPSDRFSVTASRVMVGGVERIALVGGERPGNHLHYVP